jgi:hypothetical protein
LKVLSPYANIGYFRLYYHKLFLGILLVAIGGYSIGVYIFYWWLLLVILLMAIGGAILLMVIGGY